MTSIDTWIEHWAARRPDRTAIALPEANLSWAALHRRVRSTAAALNQAGVRRHDRVAVLAGDGSLPIEVLFAAARIGAAVVPLNTRLTAHELSVILDDAEPLVIVADDVHEAAGRDAAAEARIAADLLVVDAELGVGQANEPIPDRAGSPDDVLIIAYTSGTTGQPKGAMLDQAAVAANATNVAAMMDLASTDRVYNAMPQFHVGGLNVHATPTIRAGGVLVQARRFDPAAALDELANRATLGTLVPAMLHAVQALPEWDSVQFRHLRALNTGASTVPISLIETVHATGVPVTQIYGLTETAPLALALPAEHARSKIGSCGLPGLSVEVRLIDEGGGNVPTGEPGEIVVRGQNTMRGYWRNPEATRLAFIDDGWFRTGDIARSDTDGFVFIEDRRTDVIVSGGENIYPAELESVLADIAGLDDAVIIGLPDDRWGHVPVVVAAKTDQSVTEQSILAAFDGRVARYKRPKKVIWIDELPRTPMGKVRKQELRTRLHPAQPGGPE